MSSNSYSACLTPDPWLRILVLTSGRGLLAGGLVLILILPLDAAIRALACLFWGFSGQSELRALRRGYRACSAIRVTVGGELMLRNYEREWRPATLLAGSVVLRNLAWLRLSTASGVRYAECLRGDARKSEDWRRLQVIWRHIGTGR